jgi:hypothetical protein
VVDNSDEKKPLLGGTFEITSEETSLTLSPDFKIPDYKESFFYSESTNNRCFEKYLGCSVMTYALYGHNKYVRQLRKESQDEPKSITLSHQDFLRPFKEEGLLFLPIVRCINSIDDYELWQPIPGLMLETAKFEVLQRSKNVDRNNDHVYITSNKLLVVFYEKPECDVVYIGPGKYFPHGTVAVSTQIEFVESDIMQKYDTSNHSDEEFFKVYLQITKINKSHSFVEPGDAFSYYPQWLFESEDPEIEKYREDNSINVLPKETIEKLGVKEFRKKLLETFNKEKIEISQLMKDPVDADIAKSHEERLAVVEALIDIFQNESDDEVIKIIDNLKKEKPELFSASPDSIGAPCSKVTITETTLKRKELILNKSAELLEISNGETLEGNIEKLGMRASGTFHPISQLNNISTEFGGKTDLLIKNASLVLNQAISVGNTACMMGLADCYLYHFSGDVETTQRGAIPYDESEQQMLHGNNKSGNSWNEHIGITISKPIWVYVPSENTTLAVKQLCNDLNAMIMYDTALNNLKCRDIITVIKKRRPFIKDKDFGLLPSVKFLKLTGSQVKIKDDSNITTGTYLYAPGDEYINHPLNLMYMLTDDMKRISQLPENKGLFIMDPEQLLDPVCKQLKLGIQTFKAFKSFPLPNYPLAKDLNFDLEKLKPNDINEKLRLVGKPNVGLLEEVEDSSKVSSLKGSKSDQASNLVTSLQIRKGILPSGRGRGGRFYQGYNGPSDGFGRGGGITTNYEKISSRKAAAYVFEGGWKSVPASQRKHYTPDLKYAVHLGHEILNGRRYDNEVAVVSSMPCALIYDAFMANRELKGEKNCFDRKQGYKGCRYPWRKDKQANPLHFKNLVKKLRKIADEN